MNLYVSVLTVCLKQSVTCHKTSAFSQTFLRPRFAVVTNPHTKVSQVTSAFIQTQT